MLIITSRHAEEFQLFLPGEWQCGVEFGQRERARRFPGHDRLHDQRSQQGQMEETPDVGHVHVQRFRQGFRRIEFAAVKELLPAVGSGDARGQRLVDLQLLVGQFRVVDPLAPAVVAEFDRNFDQGIAVLHLFNFGLHSPVPPEAAAFPRSEAPPEITTCDRKCREFVKIKSRSYCLISSKLRLLRF